MFRIAVALYVSETRSNTRNGTAPLRRQHTLRHRSSLIFGGWVIEEMAGQRRIDHYTSDRLTVGCNPGHVVIGPDTTGNSKECRNEGNKDCSSSHHAL